MTTAVPAPGAGVTVPVIMMGVVPVYDAAFVWTVTVYVAWAKAGMKKLPTANRTSAKNGTLRNAFLKDNSSPEASRSMMGISVSHEPSIFPGHDNTA
jgi:hypothetical protein